MQSLRLPPRQSTLHNPGINLADCYLEQCRSFPRSYLNLCCLQAYLSSLPMVNGEFGWAMTPGFTPPKNYVEVFSLPACTNWINCVDKRDRNPLHVTMLSLKIAQFYQAIPLPVGPLLLLKIEKFSWTVHQFIDTPISPETMQTCPMWLPPRSTYLSPTSSHSPLPASSKNLHNFHCNFPLLPSLPSQEKLHCSTS